MYLAFYAALRGARYRCAMVILSAALMLEALGYCAPDPWGVWPPSGSWLPEAPVVAVYGEGAPSFEQATFTNGFIEIPAQTLVVGEGTAPYVEVRPLRPLLPGTWRLTGSGRDLQWQVFEVALGTPNWVGEPRVEENWGAGFICPAGPFVALDVPLARGQRQPRVEVRLTHDGKTYIDTFPVRDNLVDLHRGCAPMGPMPAGERVQLTLVPVNAAGVPGFAKELTFFAE